MSYILDALRKAERERHLGQAPTLTALPLSVKPRRQRLGPWLGLGLGLGLNVALLGFFLTRPQPAVSPAVVATPVPVVAMPAAATAPPAPALSHPQPESRPGAAAPSRPPVPTTGRERRDDPARSLPPPGSVTLAPAPEPVPLLETLPAGARRAIPALNLDIHIHSADPAKRFVVINGRRYREGERLGEGPVLEAVTRDGAILRQGSQRFRLSVRQ